MTVLSWTKQRRKQDEVFRHASFGKILFKFGHNSPFSVDMPIIPPGSGNVNRQIHIFCKYDPLSIDKTVSIDYYIRVMLTKQKEKLYA